MARKKRIRTGGKVKGTKVTPRPGNETLAWGARQIAAIVGVTEHQCFDMMEQLPGAMKIGGRWCLHIPTFHASFGAAA